MPGTDGTGPMGFGPMTGGRRGRCVGDVPAGVPFEGTGSGKGIARGRGGGGRKVSDGRKREPGLGVRRRRRDGSGRGVGPGAQVAQTPVAAAPTPAPSSTERGPGPAIVKPARTVAIVANPDLCTLCGACLDACAARRDHPRRDGGDRPAALQRLRPVRQRLLIWRARARGGLRRCASPSPAARAAPARRRSRPTSRRCSPAAAWQSGSSTPTSRSRTATSSCTPRSSAASRCASWCRRSTTTRCTACGVCAEVCAFKAITVIGSTVLVFPELCHSCGACELLCPENAIHEEGRDTGVVEYGTVTLPGRPAFPLVTGVLSIGEAKAVPTTRATIAAADDVERRRRARSTPRPAPRARSSRRCAAPTSWCWSRSRRRSDCTTSSSPSQMVRALGLRCVVAVNRADLGDDRVQRYCAAEGLEIVLELPNDRRIAEAYSRGELLPRRGRRPGGDAERGVGAHRRRRAASRGGVMTPLVSWS